MARRVAVCWGCCAAALGIILLLRRLLSVVKKSSRLAANLVCALDMPMSVDHRHGVLAHSHYSSGNPDSCTLSTPCRGVCVVNVTVRACCTLTPCLCARTCAGVRYMFVGKALEQRSSYRVLGVLLFSQLALSACASAATLLMRSVPQENEPTSALPAGSGSSSGSSGAAEHSRQGRGQRIVVLDVSDHCCPACYWFVASGEAWLFKL